MGENAEPQVRVLESEAELVQAMALFRTAMVGLPAPTYPDGTIHDYLEPGRTFGAFVDGVLAGTVDAFSGEIVLPGGARVAHAAVTHIGVLPTHTRRGVVTALVRQQLRDARTRGDVVATLRASEATIYGRFGYGIASWSVESEVDLRRAAFRPGAPEGGPVRLLTGSEAWDLLPHIHSRHLPLRPGTLERWSQWWNSQRMRAQSTSGARYVAVHGQPGHEDGFVRYRPSTADPHDWFTSETPTIVVDDFFAPSVEAHAGIVRFLLGLDLVARVRFAELPTDDPMPWLLRDHRAVRTRSIEDETWLRVLDVERALASRVYTGDGTVTLGVVDPMFPENEGTYTISADGAARSDGQADLRIGVAELGSLLLGGVACRTLAAAGRIEVRHADAVPVADRLFGWVPAPFAGTSF